MIRKLRFKFITLAMTALIFLLTVIVVGMNVINYNSIVNEADTILDILTQNKGKFPDFGGDKMNRLPPDMSMETPHEARFFSIFFNEQKEIINIETSKIVSVDRQTAANYADIVLKKNNTRGFINEFRYIYNDDFLGSRIIFLDCGRKFDSFFTFLYASIFMAVAGLVVVFIILFIFAGRIIRPISESYDKQKRFITDAGHEMKTPLTIINANTDILEMEIGENESLADIKNQTQRLCSLTNDLVTLVRMEENENSLQKIEFPLSEVATETIHPFFAIATQQNKSISCNIEPMIILNGNDKSIKQLIGIFLENSLKYSPKESNITIDIKRQNKMVDISVCNLTQTPIMQEQLKCVFDRFYRADSSRNSEISGHGIGLSVAKAIVTAHGGKIRAYSDDGSYFKISALLPIE